MDFNHAFEATEETMNLPYQVVYGKTVSQKDAAIEAVRQLGMKIKKLDYSKYYYGSYVMKRYEQLEKNEGN